MSNPNHESINEVIEINSQNSTIENNLASTLNKYIHQIVRDAIKINRFNPSRLIFFMSTFRHQKKAAMRRSLNSESGLEVPPVLILSVTKRCNLACKGCYSNARKNQSDELSNIKLNEILTEASELGISFVLLAGGEPLIRTEIIETAAKHKNILFLLFTNGLLFDDKKLKQLKKAKNIIPIISLEGKEKETDERRGSGVFGKLMTAVDDLKKENIFFGASITVTSLNFNTVTDESFVKDLMSKGFRLLLYVEYVPVNEKDEELIITIDQRKLLNEAIEKFREKLSCLFIAFPGDEERFGGCLAAGRGFVHIAPDGGVEPCPFAPYSDVNISNTTLRISLQSEFLAEIRKNHDKLVETKGGCALWENREWVKDLMN